MYSLSESTTSKYGSHARFLSPKGVLFGIMIAAVVAFLAFIYNFLAVSSPVGQGTLVVEAWISPRALAKSLELFHSGRYSYLVVVGGPIEGSGGQSTPPRTWDDLAAKRLGELGVDPERLVRLTVPPVEEGRRTIASAMQVRSWLDRSGSSFFVDVLTAGVHARKSWVLFRYVLGNRYRVGIIAGPEEYFDRRFWFFSRLGTWFVVRNLAGYLYSEFLTLFNERKFALDDSESKAKIKGPIQTVLWHQIPMQWPRTLSL